jgi:hypothetical protein
MKIDGQVAIEIRIREVTDLGYFRRGQVIFNGVNGVSVHCMIASTGKTSLVW